MQTVKSEPTIRFGTQRIDSKQSFLSKKKQLQTQELKRATTSRTGKNGLGSILVWKKYEDQIKKKKIDLDWFKVDSNWS